MNVLERNDKLDAIRDDWKARSIWKLDVAERARILRCQTTQEEQDMLLVEGFFSYVCKNRPVVIKGISGGLIEIAKQRENATKNARERLAVIRKKAKAFDRVIERLDHQYVGNKLLGDCTRADLLRAAQSASATESNLTLDRTLYTELASLLKGNETVREARQRGEIRKLLENRYEESNAI